MTQQCGCQGDASSKTDLKKGQGRRTNASERNPDAGIPCVHPEEIHPFLSGSFKRKPFLPQYPPRILVQSADEVSASRAHFTGVSMRDKLAAVFRLLVTTSTFILWKALAHFSTPPDASNWKKLLAARHFATDEATLPVPV